MGEDALPVARVDEVVEPPSAATPAPASDGSNVWIVALGGGVLAALMAGLLLRIRHRRASTPPAAPRGRRSTSPISPTPPASPGRYKGAGVGPSPAYSYSAAVVEVTVDPETGETRVEEIWIAHDIGRAINPVVAIGQVEGSVYMGLGEALMEEMTYRGNRNVVHRHPSLLEYKSPTTHEMCPIHTFLVEDPDPNGPFGAKEVGQGPLLPIPPAVVNAIHDAVGVRIDEVPVTPQKVLAALKRKAKGEEAREGPDGVPEFAWPDPVRVPTPEAGGDGQAVDDPRHIGAGGVRGSVPGGSVTGGVPA